MIGFPLNSAFSVIKFIDKSSILSNAGTVPVNLSTALFVVICGELAGLTDTSTAIIITSSTTRF